MLPGVKKPIAVISAFQIRLALIQPPGLDGSSFHHQLARPGSATTVEKLRFEIRKLRFCVDSGESPRRASGTRRPKRSALGIVIARGAPSSRGGPHDGQWIRGSAGGAEPGVRGTEIEANSFSARGTMKPFPRMRDLQEFTWVYISWRQFTAVEDLQKRTRGPISAHGGERGCDWSRGDDSSDKGDVARRRFHWCAEGYIRGCLSPRSPSR